MKIELRNIKHAAFASEETNCYEATVYVDGVKVGHVANDGHGGCDHQHIPQGMLDKLNAWCAANIMTEPNPFNGEVYPTTFEDYCANTLEAWLVERDVKRLIASKALFQKAGDNRLYTMPFKQKGRTWPAETVYGVIEQRNPDCTILNRLPLERAVQIYRASV